MRRLLARAALLSSLLTGTAGHAAPVRLCTDLGPLIAEEAEDGRITGTMAGRWPVEGSSAALLVRDGQGRLRYQGPLSALHPMAPPDLPDPDPFALQVVRLLEQTGHLVTCPLAGVEALRVGRFPEPIPLPAGHRVVFAGTEEILLRSDGGVAWLLDLAMGRDQAAGLARELQDRFPERDARVVLRGSRALVAVQAGTQLPLPAGLEPAAEGAELPLLHLLRPPPALDDPLSVLLISPALVASAWEMLLQVNQQRRHSGLASLEPEPGLTWAALAHCAYLDWALQSGQGALGHIQVPASPVFLATTPEGRRGGGELVAYETDFLPWEAVHSWLQAPFHRASLIRPDVMTVGVCATGAGARVVEAYTDLTGDYPQVFLYPSAGLRDVPLAFDGLEDPDPVPLERFPERELPLGFPLSAYFEVPPAGLLEVGAWLHDEQGQEVPFYFVSPEDHPHLAEARRAEAHLVPERPLRAGHRYRWGVRYRLQVERPTTRGRRLFMKTEEIAGELETSFNTRTVVQATELPPLDERTQALLAALGEARQRGGARPLARDPAVEVAAALLVEGEPDAAQRVLPGVVAASACLSPRQVQAARHHAEQYLARLLEPSFTRVGVFRTRGATCLLAAGPEARPLRWDCRKDGP